MRSSPSCLWRGVCPRDIAMIAIAAPDCALRRPRRRQPTTLPAAALWMAAPYHVVTRASLGKLLSRSLPPLAQRPLLAPVTTRFPHSAPHRRPGSDRHAPHHFCNRSTNSFRSATPCTAPRCRQAARLWVSRSASAARSQAAMGRSIADRHPASLAEAVSLPGPDGFRHTQPQQALGLEALVTTQAHGVSVRPGLHHPSFTSRNRRRASPSTDQRRLLSGPSCPCALMLPSRRAGRQTPLRAPTPPTPCARSCSPAPPPQCSSPAAPGWPPPSGFAGPFVQVPWTGSPAPRGPTASAGGGRRAC